jgi:hypothetical protein
MCCDNHDLVYLLPSLLSTNFPMQDSNRDGGPGFFRGASYINASNNVFNQAGRDQYNVNYNNAINDEIVVRR